MVNQSNFTDFGRENINPDEKRRRINSLFDSVASNYDLMNDLMSFGVHRLWKRYTAYISAIKPGDIILDVAGGTGDMARLFSRRVGEEGSVTICDISFEMISMGRNRLIDSRDFNNINLVQGDAENLPFMDNRFDMVSIAFGLRNLTDKNQALKSMYSKLKFGGRILILEFSSVILDVLKPVYNSFSENYIPMLGRLIAKDEPSYRYLIESIRRHPDQRKLKAMLEDAGFSRVNYQNMSGGIVAIHQAFKL